ncbi:MAG TPA: hypothetical protein VGA01_15815, partial [Candidatus Binatia bacterium]
MVDINEYQTDRGSQITDHRSHRFASSPLDNTEARGDYSIPVSVLFFKRFLQRPFQVASIIPSS